MEDALAISSTIDFINMSRAISSTPCCIIKLRSSLPISSTKVTSVRSTMKRGASDAFIASHQHRSSTAAHSPASAPASLKVSAFRFSCSVIINIFFSLCLLTIHLTRNSSDCRIGINRRQQNDEQPDGDCYQYCDYAHTKTIRAKR